PLPRPDRLRIIHADCPVVLDDPSSAFRGLPLQRIASQRFGRSPLPHIAPELFVPSSSFPSLNAGRHGPEFIPSRRRRAISIALQKVSTIVQSPDSGIPWHGH